MQPNHVSGHYCSISRHMLEREHHDAAIAWDREFAGAGWEPYFFGAARWGNPLELRAHCPLHRSPYAWPVDGDAGSPVAEGCRCRRWVGGAWIPRIAVAS